MSVLPADQLSRLAESVLGVATQAEGSLLQLVARHIVQGLDSPGWAGRQLVEIRAFRQAARVVADRYRREAVTGVDGVLQQAANLGTDAARAEIRRYARQLGQLDTSQQHGRTAVLQLAAEMAGLVSSSADTVLRQADDAYRRAVSQVIGNVLLGTETRRQVTQRALNQLAGQGMTGFVDRSGRRWDLVSYLEMATRTAVQRASTAAHTEALSARGINLVIVSNAPQECPRCRPWEGKVLSTDGTSAGTVTLPDLAGDGTVQVRINGTLEQARASGLFHPGCRHSTSAYLPGVTKRPPAGSTADPAGDRARTRLRELERRVRRYKRAELVALDDLARARAQRQVRAAQAAIRDHVANTSVRRVRAREQLVLPS